MKSQSLIFQCSVEMSMLSLPRAGDMADTNARRPTFQYFNCIFILSISGEI